ncbi:hypothetical protein F2P56_005917 [Juglans regia]|uniref:Protein WVD2-like 4 isoform X1 n=2 Tax=Juglans regia TaxID=51240 RepID=A0A2I4GY18_JUGRE|nr:protein WVD2-like 4 isoform X1 [Juglans regia]XP_018848799.2 protein WVD2-like 4 isoform X1 [Juglans regia]XP_018848801.2 protein WVD2-like 4 isoform X1 [Juglans regia]KAF5473971.1 hypothetical protein F2P56_005917 [Juglans regia]
MESENGVTVKDESSIIERKYVEESVVDLKREVEDGGNGEVPTMSGKPDPATKIKSLKSSGVVVKASAMVPASKTSKSIKEPGNLHGGSPKNNRLGKDKPNPIATTTFSRSQRSILTQSLSFPSRGVRSDVMNKSIEVYPVKRDQAKHAQRQGTKSQASSGTVTNTMSGAPSRRTSLASMPTIRRTVYQPGKYASLNATINCPPAEESLSVNPNLNPIKAALLVKEDDEARSTTSSATPRGTPCDRRSSGSGFSFKLDERAEKRREFFSKLEEKIQAKEVERTNLQAKSKENQEAEIKQLRKSLTFKATPMPSFYKEPPPRAELKKIPTTRAISPKLGRQKGSVTVTNNSSEGDGPGLSPRLNPSPKLKKNKNSVTANNSSEVSASCRGPHLNREHSNSNKGLQAESDKNVVASKKTIRKSQTRLQTQESAVTKTERKPAKSKTEDPGEETQNQKECRGEGEESQNQSMCLSECSDEIDPESEMDTAQNNAPVLNSSTLEIMPHEVTVGG